MKLQLTDTQRTITETRARNAVLKARSGTIAAAKVAGSTIGFGAKLLGVVVKAAVTGK